MIPLVLLGGMVAMATILFVLAGPVPLTRSHTALAQAGSASPTSAQDAETSHGELAALSASVVQTWTHTTRADWEAGTLEWLDSATVSGSLQLAQRFFSANATVTPRSGLASRQTAPDIAVDSAGNACAVWVDYRNGNENGNGDVYFARRPVGGSWGANVKVNDTLGTVSRWTVPAIVVDGSGNAYIVWTDERNGNADIYFAYCPAGGACGANVKVNDDAGSGEQSGPAIAVDGSGNAYAVWDDSRHSGSDIYFSYRPAGGIWGVNVEVNDDTGTARQYTPAIAVDASGNAYAAWTDRRNDPTCSGWPCNDDVYFAYRPAGGNWGINTRVNDDAGTTSQSTPAITVDANRNAYAVWHDSRSGGNGDIYFAYRPADSMWGANSRVNDIVNQAPWFGALDIAVDGNGNTYAVWEDWRDGAGGAYLYTYSSLYFAYRPSNGVWGANVRVNDSPQSKGMGDSCAIGVDSSGNAYAIWTDQRNAGNYDVYSAYRPSGGTWGANTPVNDDSMTTQWSPAVAIDSGGNAYAVWTDLRNDADIYFAYRPAGGAWGVNVKVNDDSGTANQWSPAIAVDSSGNAYAVWEDYRNSNWDIYFAYRPVGGAWGANVEVNDTAGTVGQWGSPAIAVDGSGNAYAVWSDERNGNRDIYFAYRPAGGAWGANVRVNDDPGTAYQGYPAIAVDGSGNAYAVWSDERNGNRDICFAYRPVGGAWGANVRVNDDPGIAYQGYPAIAVDGSGNAYAVWTDYRNGSIAIYSAYRPAGGNWQTNHRLGQGPSWSVGGGDSAIGVDGSGNAYAVWATSREGIFFAYRPAGGEWGSGVLINDNDFEMMQQNPDIAVNPSGVAYAMWTDARYGAGGTYFARLLSTPEYVPEGTYTSPELNTGVVAAAWESLTDAATIPAGTSLAFETRSRSAGGAWTEWQPVLSPIASPPGQYLQYRVTFSTTLTNATPLLDQVQIAYRSAGTPSAPRFATPCGVTSQTTPTLRGSAAGGSTVRLYVDGSEVATATASVDGVFSVAPVLSAGSHTFTATAENESGAGPASTAMTLLVNPALPYDPINVRAGQWSKDGWLMSVPRDANGCANPDNNWRVWPRANAAFRVEVPVSYTTSAAVTVTVGTQTITLTEGTGKVFAGVFQPPIQGGPFVIQVNADGQVATVTGGPVLIDPDGVVYEASGTLSDTIAGAQVTLYYFDTHSGQWVVWDAWNYGQVNPQTTLDDGYYSFYTPPGTYRVTAEKEGYPVYTSPDLVVVSTPVRHNIPLGYRVYLPLVLR